MGKVKIKNSWVLKAQSMVTKYQHLKVIHTFENIVDTRCTMQYFHTLSPPVTLKIEPWTPKVDMSEILSMVTICPNSKAIHKTIWKYHRHKCTMQYFHTFSVP